MGILEFHWRQLKKKSSCVTSKHSECSEFAERFSCSVLFPTVLFSYHLWHNQGKTGPFPPRERCRSIWLETARSFGNHKIHSDTFPYLAYSCQTIEQGRGRSLETWTKCLTLSSLSFAGHRTTCFVSNTGGVSFGWQLWRRYVFFLMVSMLLSRKQPRRADSATMATISSRETMDQSD